MINKVNQLKMIKYKIFLRLLVVGLGLETALASGALAQQVIVITDTSLYSIRQESIPPNDSGGRWVLTTLLFTNRSGLPVRVLNYPCRYAATGGGMVSDSTLAMADSLYQTDWGVGFPNPLKYKDSILQEPNQWGGSQISFIIPPYGTDRVSFWSRTVGYGTKQPDTISQDGIGIQAVSDSIVGSINYRRWCDQAIYAEELAPCSSPFVVKFDNVPLNNAQYPVVLDGYSSWTYRRGLEPTDTIAEPTEATYQIVGEYSDRFIPPVNETYRNGLDFSFTFNGAPRSVVHDTLLSTFSDCYGTVTTRTPIEAYSIVDMRNCYRLSGGSSALTAQFFGSVLDTTTIINTSIFPIELTNLQLSNYNNERNFQVVSAPSVIAANGSGAIIVRFSDNDKRHDADYPTYSATLTGVLSPYQQDVTFRDSAFSMDLSGTVNVYCPYSPNYFYLVPLIKHGLHPAGIVFFSNNISTKFSTGKSFITEYGNDDTVSEYFYPPYYDDPHFKITIGNISGFGSATLPALMPPDTHAYLPSWNTIETLTEFTGDDYHNYRTQLHWPRANDTVTMDVLALGADAPPYDGVAMKTLLTGFSIWPNPASSTLNIGSVEPGANIIVYDLLGRELLSAELLSNTPIDISKLHPGIYSVVLSSKDAPTVVQKLTIVR
jgi:hypothetical protein